MIIYKICLIILRSIFKKALNKNNIFNLILKFFINFLLLYLYQIFNKCWDTETYFMYVWFLTIIVFYKFKIFNYYVIKVYCFIALIYIFKNVFEFIFIKKSYI